MNFRIRTITAGITLSDLDDLSSIGNAINFLDKAKNQLETAGYEVQTLRIATQSLCELVGSPDKRTIDQLMTIDKMAAKSSIMLSVGELIAGDVDAQDLANWAGKLVKATTNISFSISVGSEANGIHYKSIKVAASVCKALAENSPGGEANFRFTASANCQPGIPFFPAAYHKGPNSFAIGLEYPNVITEVFKNSNWEYAESDLKVTLNKIFQPIETIAKGMESSDWRYDGIDTSPAPGLDASIGEAIETLTGKPFGSVSTLNACAIITKAIKDLSVKICGYSGLMLPVIEDKVLAKRAIEKRYSVEELLLFSAVSGTGLDVVPLAGDVSEETLAGVYQDLAALSLRYFNKPLSARLFPIPGKQGGDKVSFENPYLTNSVIMELK
ncbi:MAG: DUF711 family protein [Bacteroidota bacterium]